MPEIATGENAYETGLFRLAQSGEYRLYPMEFMNLAPYEGEFRLELTGLGNLLGYFDGLMSEARPGSEEALGLGAVKSGLIVLRNLAREGEGGALTWDIQRPDVTREELVLNGITLRYPDLMEYMPILISSMVFRM